MIGQIAGIVCMAMWIGTGWYAGHVLSPVVGVPEAVLSAILATAGGGYIAWEMWRMGVLRVPSALSRGETV